MELNCDAYKLIQAVEERPTLYVQANRRDSDWQLERNRLWQEVAEIVFAGEIHPQDITKDHITKLKKKWISLRDQFVKACKSLRKFGSGEPGKKKSKYIYYERLMFLAPHVKSGDIGFACSPPRDDEDYDGMIEQLAHSSDEDSVNISLSDFKLEEKEEHVQEESRTIKAKNGGIKRPRSSRENLVTIKGYAAPKEPYPIPVQDPYPVIVEEVHPPNPEDTENFPVGPSTSTTKEQVETIVSATAQGFASVLNMNTIRTLKEREVDDDPLGHKTFLMSCLPFFNGMSQKQILKARAKILTAIEEISADNSTPESIITTARNGNGVPPRDNQTFGGIPIEDNDTVCWTGSGAKL